LKKEELSLSDQNFKWILFLFHPYFCIIALYRVSELPEAPLWQSPNRNATKSSTYSIHLVMICWDFF